MKNLLKKIRNFKLIRETSGEIVLTVIVVSSIFLAAIGIAGSMATDMQPYTYAAGENREGDVTGLADESAATPTSAQEEAPEVIIEGPVFTRYEFGIGKYGSGDPDPTLNNKFSEEVVLPPEEDSDWGKNQSVEEMFGGTVEFEYIKAISDENKENQSKESESDKISDENTKKQLAQNQLPDDKLSIDIYNSI
ncbi:MAG: hypothetical protein ACYC0D_04950 [Candidatus Humimicrobiaceae bacterium]